MPYVVSKTGDEYTNIIKCETDDEAKDILATVRAAQPFSSHSVSEDYPEKANPKDEENK